VWQLKSLRNFPCALRNLSGNPLGSGVIDGAGARADRIRRPGRFSQSRAVDQGFSVGGHGVVRWPWCGWADHAMHSIIKRIVVGGPGPSPEGVSRCGGHSAGALPAVRGAVAPGTPVWVV